MALLGFLCGLGVHRPAEGEVWNRGYWFTRCARCEADLVRTPSGRWHVPKGQKVVWKQRRPRGRRRSQRKPDEAGPS